MPPKPKLTKEQIINTALRLVSENGVGSLTARELGNALGSSARPIFTVFSGMDEVRSAVIDAAEKKFSEYAEKTSAYPLRFKSAGMQMLLFAKGEPKLFQLLFMQENSGVKSFDDLFNVLGDFASECIDYIINDYGIEQSDARLVFENLWIYTFGLGSLCATGACDFSESELSGMLGTEFAAMMALIKKDLPPLAEKRRVL